MLVAILNTYIDILEGTDEFRSLDKLNKPVWNDCYQWVVAELSSVYDGIVDYKIAGLEMVALYIAWKNNINLRPVLHEYHNKNRKPQYLYLEEVISVNFPRYSERTNSVPLKKVEDVAAEVFRRAMRTFKPDPHYQFGRVDFIDVEEALRHR